MKITDQIKAEVASFTQAIDKCKELGPNVDDWTMNDIHIVSPQYSGESNAFCPYTALYIKYSIMDKLKSITQNTKNQVVQVMKHYERTFLANNILPRPPIRIQNLYNNYQNEEPINEIRRWAIEVSAVWVSLPEYVGPTSPNDKPITLQSTLPFFRTYLGNILGHTFTDKQVSRTFAKQVFQLEYLSIPQPSWNGLDPEEIPDLNYSTGTITVRTGFEVTSQLPILEGIEHIVSLVENTKRIHDFVEKWNIHKPPNDWPQTSSTTNIIKKYNNSNFLKKKYLRIRTGRLTPPKYTIDILIHQEETTHHLRIDSTMYNIQQSQRYAELLHMAALIQTDQLASSSEISSRQLSQYHPRPNLIV